MVNKRCIIFRLHFSVKLMKLRCLLIKEIVVLIFSNLKNLNHVSIFSDLVFLSRFCALFFKFGFPIQILSKNLGKFSK